MPEGDTVHTLAAYLAPELAGRELIAGMARAGTGVDLAGRRVDGVFARGKHLYIELDGHCLLRSHLGMWGSWHAYAGDERWRKPRRQASIILHRGDRVFVCFNASQVEILRRAGVRHRALEAALGPDLLTGPVDDAQVLIRARELSTADTPVLDVLLDQRVASGIGNVYKSEVLFLEHTDPVTPLGGIGDDDLVRIYRRAARLLRRNTGGGPRTTRHAGDGASRLWVYRRGGLPCLRCDAIIRTAQLGKGRRSTYWCPSCQAGKMPDEPAAR